MSDDPAFYRSHSRWSDPGDWTDRLRAVSPEPAAVVRVVSGLLMHPFLAPVRGVAVPEQAADDRTLRAVPDILGRLAARDARSFDQPRAPADRGFCTCATFARLSVAILRTHAVAARLRVGFADYFDRGHWEDHWVAEYRDGDAWRLLDAELDDVAVRDLGIDFPPHDVPRGRFLDASSVWRGVRRGEIDPSRCGLSPLGITGDWFVAQSVLRDAAALNKDEMLPWETWSIGRELGPQQRTTETRHAAALDLVADRLAGAPDAAVARAVYAEHPWLRPGPTVLSFVTGTPTEVAV